MTQNVILSENRRPGHPPDESLISATVPGNRESTFCNSSFNFPKDRRVQIFQKCSTGKRLSHAHNNNNSVVLVTEVKWRCYLCEVSYLSLEKSIFSCKCISLQDMLGIRDFS